MNHFLFIWFWTFFIWNMEMSMHRIKLHVCMRGGCIHCNMWVCLLCVRVKFKVCIPDGVDTRLELNSPVCFKIRTKYVQRLREVTMKTVFYNHEIFVDLLCIYLSFGGRNSEHNRSTSSGSRIGGKICSRDGGVRCFYFSQYENGSSQPGMWSTKSTNSYFICFEKRNNRFSKK